MELSVLEAEDSVEILLQTSSKMHMCLEPVAWRPHGCSWVGVLMAAGGGSGPVGAIPSLSLTEKRGGERIVVGGKIGSREETFSGMGVTCMLAEGIQKFPKCSHPSKMSASTALQSKE